MRDRPLLREHVAAGGSIRGVSRDLGASRNAVRRALAPGARDSYHRASASEAAEAAVRDVLVDYPHMAVVDIAVVIDWRRSRRQLQDVVARLRPVYVADGPRASARPLTTIEAGRLATVGTLTVGTVTL